MSSLRTLSAIKETIEKMKLAFTHAFIQNYLLNTIWYEKLF